MERLRSIFPQYPDLTAVGFLAPMPTAESHPVLTLTWRRCAQLIGGRWAGCPLTRRPFWPQKRDVQAFKGISNEHLKGHTDHYRITIYQEFKE